MQNQNDHVPNIDFEEKTSFSEKVQPITTPAKKGLIAIWPTIIRFINTVIYYGIKIIKGIISTILSQIK